MTYLTGDRVTLRGRTGSVAMDLGGDQFGVLLDRQGRSEQYQDLHVFAGIDDLSPIVTTVEDEEEVPTYSEGLTAAAEYATAERPDLHASSTQWRQDFSRWINELQVRGENGSSIGSGGFQVTLHNEDDLTIFEITSTLFPFTHRAATSLRVARSCGLGTTMATFSLTFKTNSPAFNDRYEFEVQAIFDKVAEQVEDGVEQSRVYDSDGNPIGWFSSDFDASMLEELDYVE